MSKLERRIIFPTPEEDAAINAGIAANPDTRELTDEDFARMRPAVEVDPRLAEFLRKERATRKACPKTRVTLRLDDDVLARLREDGPGWQTRANYVLRRALLGA